jgi:hypothetical protein
MNVVHKPYDVQEVSVTVPGFDKVHAEAVCRLLRQNTAEIDMAAHSTDYGQLVIRIRTVTPGRDVRECIKEAAAQRVHELNDLLSVFGADPRKTVLT